MRDWLLKAWFSLSFRATFMFIVVLLLGLFWILIVWASQRKLNEQPSEFPVQFLTSLVHQIEQNSSDLAPVELLRNTKYFGRFEDDDSFWVSGGHIPSPYSMHLLERINAQIAIVESKRGYRYLRINTDLGVYVFRHENAIRSTSFYAWILSSAPFVFIGFLCFGLGSFYYVFLPLKWLRKGAQRIGEGDLDYRIPNIRKNEFGQLIEIINKMAEDLQFIFDSKRQLLLAISHELKSPITRIKLNIAMLEHSPRIGKISQDIDQLNTIIDSLLEAESLQGKHQVLNKELIFLSDLLLDLVNEYDDEGIHFINHLTQQEPQIEVDIARLHFVFKNLVDNAVKYTEETRRQIDIGLRAECNQLIVQVEDNGSGISEQDIDYIFDAFYRADASRDRDSGGVGLGLYLSQEIVFAHSGEIKVQRGRVVGSRFSIYLPLVPVSPTT